MKSKQKGEALSIFVGLVALTLGYMVVGGRLHVPDGAVAVEVSKRGNVRLTENVYKPILQLDDEFAQGERISVGLKASPFNEVVLCSDQYTLEHGGRVVEVKILVDRVADVYSNHRGSTGIDQGTGYCTPASEYIGELVASRPGASPAELQAFIRIALEASDSGYFDNIEVR